MKHTHNMIQYRYNYNKMSASLGHKLLGGILIFLLWTQSLSIQVVPNKGMPINDSANRVLLESISNDD